MNTAAFHPNSIAYAIAQGFHALRLEPSVCARIEQWLHLSREFNTWFRLEAKRRCDADDMLLLLEQVDADEKQLSNQWSTYVRSGAAADFAQLVDLIEQSSELMRSWMRRYA